MRGPSDIINQWWCLHSISVTFLTSIFHFAYQDWYWLTGHHVNISGSELHSTLLPITSSYHISVCFHYLGASVFPVIFTIWEKCNKKNHQHSSILWTGFTYTLSPRGALIFISIILLFIGFVRGGSFVWWRIWTQA